MLRILYVVPWLFYQPINTASEYHLDLINALAGRGHRVDVVCFTTNIERLSMLESERIAIHALPGSLVRLTSASTLLESIRTATPISIVKYSSRLFLSEIAKVIGSSNRPDVALLEHIEVAQYARTIEQSGIPVLLHLIDIEAQRLELLGRNSHSWFVKSGAWFESRRMRSYELKFAKNTNTVCLSESDKSILKKIQPDLEIGVVPLALNLERYPLDSSSHKDDSTIIFTGPANYYKNAMGLKWFLDNVYPHTLRLWPQVRLRVVNVKPDSPMDRHIKKWPRTETVGFIEDIQAEMRQAAVSIAPMIVGSGVSGRVLTSLALGIPTVATNLACQGLNVTHGNHLWIADDPIEFARGIVSLARLDPEEKAIIISKGRRYVEDSHDIKKVVLSLECQLTQLA